MKNIKKYILLFLPFSVFGQFGNQIVIDDDGFAVTEFLAADIDNDGLQDILVADNEVNYYRNEGNGVFGEKQTISETTNFGLSLTRGDFNNDGWTDIVVATSNFQNSELFLLINNYGNSFSQITLDNGLHYNTDVKATDIDNDGDDDIILTTDIELIIYYNETSTIFIKTPIESGIFTEYYTLGLMDIDSNGFKDIIVGGTKAIIYKNTNGTIEFDAIKTNAIPDNTGLVFLINTNDFDGNGTVDLLINHTSDNIIKWYSNDGLGNFSNTNIIDANAIQCFSLASADFDDDGDIDLFTALPQSGEVVWYQNDGLGNFGNRILVNTGTVPSTKAVYSSKFNNDDLPDIIWSSETINIQLNNTSLLNIGSVNIVREMKILPNPSTNFIQITGLNKLQKFSIYNILGIEIKKGYVTTNETIEIKYLTTGVYFLKFESGETFKFIKE